MSLDCLGASIPAPSIDDVRIGRGVIKTGMTGESVTTIQQMAGMSGGDVDGDFGSKTKTAIEKFQKAHGLKADGEVGRETMSALDAAAGLIDFTGPAPTPKPSVTRIDFSEPDVIVSKIAKGKAQRVPTSGAAIEPEQPSNMRTYAAYGLGAVGAGGLLYLLLK